MYAILEISGYQFKAEEKKYIYVPHINQAKGSSITFDKVLFLSKGGDNLIGEPYIEGMKALATILENVKSDKVVVFKKIRRKGYKKKQGHRQDYTKVLIESIG